MASNDTVQSSKLDILKWLLIFVLLAAGISANYYFEGIAWAIRLAGAIVLGCALLGLAATTDKGRLAWGFVKAAKAELRKVVWPNRDETVKTTAMVIVMVIIMALVLWGLDSLFMWLISMVAGQA
jgi:preprotein translocase subunit SecE